MKKEKTIPSLLGIVLLVAGTIGGIYLTGNTKIFSPRASASCLPQNPQITNQTHNSFDLSFLTDADCRFSLLVDNRTIFDQVDNGKIHYFQVNGLQSDTIYSFILVGNGNQYTSKNYQTKTGKSPTSPLPTSNLAWGKIYDSNHQPVTTAIVYLSIPQASPLSALVTSSGNWNISLASCFNETKDNWFSPGENLPEDIVVISVDGVPTQVTNNTANNNPVPDIILGRNQLSEPPQIQEVPGNLPRQSSTAKAAVLEINYPNEADVVRVGMPDFFGRGTPNTNIDLILVSGQLRLPERAFVDSQGIWHHSPSQPLSPGQYTLTVSAANSQTGKDTTISRHFTVDLAGQLSNDSNLLAFSASASATKTPTRPATPTPTVKPAPTKTPTPSLPKSTVTVIPSPSAHSTLTPTPSPKTIPTVLPTTRVARPSVSVTPPQSGVFFPTAVLFGLSLLLVASGFFLIYRYH